MLRPGSIGATEKTERNANLFDPISLATFALVVLGLIVIPGPAVLLTLARAIRDGRRVGLATGCDLVAEGIENEAERDTLTDLEVRLGQGYLLGRPAIVS